MTRVLLIEGSIGVAGSTVSLCSLVNHLDRRRFEPHVVVARADQAAYLSRHLTAATDMVLLQPGRSLREGRVVGRLLAAIQAGCPRLYPIARRIVALGDLVGGGLPYGLRLYRLARRKDITLIHHNNGFDVRALLAARLLGVPLVGYQRGDEWNSALVRRLAPGVARYIANSGATKANLVELGLAPAAIRVVYPPVDTGRFDLRRPATRRRTDFGVPDDAPCFGIVGSLLRWKGHGVFMAAARQVIEAVPGAWAWVVGGAMPGELEYEQELREMARGLGIGERVLFTGFVDDVPAVMRLLDVVVHASVRPEPFGRVIAEAMVMGKPVVASDSGGPREIIEEGRTGFLVTPGEPGPLAERVIALLRDRPRAERIGAAGRSEACTRFSADAHAQQVMDVYADVLRAGGAGSVPTALVKGVSPC